MRISPSVYVVYILFTDAHDLLMCSAQDLHFYLTGHRTDKYWSNNSELNYPFKHIVLRNFQLKISMALSFCRVVCLMSLSCRSARGHCSFQCGRQIYATCADSLDCEVKVSVDL